jgi:hypothetical protein
MTVPNYWQVANELAERLRVSADAAADTEVPPEHRTPTAYRLARLRFAARVVRELGHQVDQLAIEAQQAGDDPKQVADARSDRSPAALRVDPGGPTDV